MWEGRPRAKDDPYWIEHGKVWVEYAPGRHRLVDLEKPAPTPVARSSFPAPMIIRDAIEPCYGADGQMHDSLSSLRKTYHPSGNPKGKRYIEIGEEKVPEYRKPEFDEGERREHIKAAIEDVKYGRVPPITALSD
jgi:hypothetical protein